VERHRRIPVLDRPGQLWRPGGGRGRDGGAGRGLGGDGKSARSVKLTLVGRSRRDIRVTSNFKDAEQAIEMIVQEIHDRIKPSSRAGW
jgi:hypothetical protein